MNVVDKAKEVRCLLYDGRAYEAEIQRQDEIRAWIEGRAARPQFAADRIERAMMRNPARSLATGPRNWRDTSKVERHSRALSRARSQKRFHPRP